MQLRDYQLQAKNAIISEWEKGIKKTLLVLPTGCHAKGEQVLMANGSTRAVEEVKIGDQLLGANGLPRNVLCLTQGTGMMCKIIPVKGKPFIVNEDHILTLIRTGERQNPRFPSDLRGGEIIDISVKEWLSWSKYQKHIHKLVRSGIIEKFQNKSVSLNISPYFLGVLLGDGGLTTTINVTTPDYEIVEILEKEAEHFGMYLHTEPAGKAKTYIFKGGNSLGCKGGKLHQVLTELGIRGCLSIDKHVPYSYKTLPIVYRLEIIAGLIDTDGSVSAGGYDFISKSKQLSEDLVFMCRSVGLAAYIKECQKSCQNNFTGTYYRVFISGNCSIIPCRVKRKKLSPRLQKKSVLRTGFSVETVGLGEYYGFTVDGDNRYLLDDFTITHNCGKTIVFSKLAEDCVRNGERVLILAHRGELLDQASDKLSKVTGLGCSVEKAENTCLGSWYRVVVGSVQSLMRENRLAQFPQNYFNSIIVDEAHHCLSDSYQRVLQYFNQSKVLGVTATPDRGDKQNLGQYFESLAYEYTLPRAIKDGYLCKIKAQTIPLKLDLTGVGIQAGDYKAADLGNALDPYLYQIAEEMVKYCPDRKTVVFLPLIKTSQKFRNILENKGFRAAEVNGDSQDRAQVLADFDAGRYNVLCNSMLLCLDMQTEILTDKGFVKYDEMTMQHKIANWNIDGTVYFEEPKEIVKRPLGINEHMVSIDSRTINLNVTNTHRMVVSNDRKKWQKISADELRNGHLLPAFGIAEPFNIQIEQPVWPEITQRDIVKTAYNIRKSTGCDKETSYTEARKRKEEQRELFYAQPKNLTLDDCRFIGFWIADGSCNRPKSGGIEYTLCQSPNYPNIVKWIDNLIYRLGFDFIRREKTKKPKAILWSLPRGTGSGKQQRKGLFRIEPYLNKNGTELFWGLNEQQFDAMVEGYWYGDGWHGQAETGMSLSIMMNDTKKEWINLLCTLGSIRGWRCHMMPRPSKNPKHNDQWGLRMVKGRHLNISYKTPITHSHEQQDVWCVRTSSKNIITRRNGYVTVMGNTEGWDCPSVDCIVVLRPTKIRSLYAQMVGRGTRLFPEKDHLLLLDFLWYTTRHELCRPAHLICESAEVAEKMTQAIETAGNPIDIEAAEIQAKDEVVEAREKALAKQLQEMRNRKRKLVDPLQFEMSIQAEDLANYVPAFGWEMGPPTDQQIQQLEKLGIFPDKIESAGKAQKILNHLTIRRIEGLTTPKQIRFLEGKGFQHVGTWQFEHAKQLIDQIAGNCWKVPRDIVPNEYKPAEINYDNLPY